MNKPPRNTAMERLHDKCFASLYALVKVLDEKERKLLGRLLRNQTALIVALCREKP